MLVIICRDMDNEKFHFAATVEGGVFGDNDHISLTHCEDIISDDILTLTIEDVNNTVADGCFALTMSTVNVNHTRTRNR